MRTTFLIEQHEKALRILECIQKAQSCNNDHASDIERLEKLQFWHPYKNKISKLEERISINNKIIERLSNYYSATMQRVVYSIASKNIAA